jgi:LuxR family transcriptional regulator, maltose regulon positive regulatory protein
VQALDTGAADARLLAADALRRSAAIGFNRFLMPHPAWAAQVAAIGLDDGVEAEFVAAAIRARSLAPPQPWREAWPWRVHVHAFGGLRVQVDGVPLGPAGAKAARKPTELLVALASQGNEPVAASRLIDLLWPSLEANAPKASLEMALTRLRKWLGVPDAVLMADGNLRLNPALVWTDVGAFMAASRHASDASALAALALYRGPLLGTEPLASLPQRAREQLSARHERLAVDTVDRLMARGDTAAAAHWCEQALEHAPLAEPLYRALMQLQLQAGEQVQALRTWARCEARLKAELGVAPSPQTRELLARLR